ncbi:MAG TPA: DUF4350 domain-containing protein [Marmoricola sp.]|nr:DUF4350 domain-containing protein [Marmoricola sp.]
MSTTTAPGTAQAGAPTAPTARWWRRHRAGLIVLAALVIAIGFAAAGSSGHTYSADLDPSNPGPTGARAVAHVLADQGVTVTVVRSAAALDRTALDENTTVVVTSADDLGPSTLARLQRDLGAADLVIVHPGYTVAQDLGQPDGLDLRHTANVGGDCNDPTYDHLRISSRTGTAYPEINGSGCFRVGQRYLLLKPGGNVTLLGSADLLTNEQITHADNAAIALRLLGQNPRLIWYVPDPRDQVAGDAVPFHTLLPHWLGPASLLAVIALIALILWRGRRLGRLVTEPLPVVITAIESTRSRGRLYRKAGDRAHAAAALRRATRVRIADHLGLPRQAADDVEVLVRSLAPHTRTDPARLRELIGPGPEPRTDNDLILLANHLADLMREARSS